MEKELIEHQKVATVVDNVHAAIADMNTAFDLMIGAKKRLGAVLGESGKDLSGRYYDKLWKDRIGDHNLAEEKRLVGKQLERNGWHYLIDQTGLKTFMTEKRRKEFYTELESDTVPPLTTENIFNSLMGLVNRVPQLLKEHVDEVFEWLRPANSQLKTNHKWRVGKKAIVWAVENWGGRSGFHINHYRDQNFRSLGSVFALLDGKGIPQYPDDFYTRFNEWLRSASAGDQFGDNYFKVRIFANGNTHIEFMRQDLVDKLNQIGGDGSLSEGERPK